jgi:hypothetical protein
MNYYFLSIDFTGGESILANDRAIEAYWQINY